MREVQPDRGTTDVHTRAGANVLAHFFQNFKPDTTLGLRRLDLALQRGWETWSDRTFNLPADGLHVCNYDNVDRYDLEHGPYGAANPAFGSATAYRQPTRTFELSFSIDWC